MNDKFRKAEKKSKQFVTIWSPFHLSLIRSCLGLNQPTARLFDPTSLNKGLALTDDLCRFTNRSLELHAAENRKAKMLVSPEKRQCLLDLRPFSLHVGFKQNLSLAPTNRREKKEALTAKNIH